MIKHFFVVILRDFRKQRGFAAINLLGLAIGLACAILLGLFVHFEWSFDRYHQHADRIYRVISLDEGGWLNHSTHTSAQLGEVVKDELPEVEAVFRVSSYSPPYIQFSVGGERFSQEKLIAADRAIGDALDFTFIHGNPRIALNEVHSVVLTESTALRYFGRSDVVGKTLNIHRREDSQPFQVTGVIADPPKNSFFQFDLLAPFEANEYLLQFIRSKDGYSWNNLSCQSFLLTHKPVELEDFREKLSALIPQGESNALRYEMYAQPMTDIRLGIQELGVKPVSDIRILYIFSCIAILILLIACINFINLSTARASTRLREISVRKVLGATTSQLFRQFFGEAFVYTFLAAFFGLVIADLSVPYLNQLLDIELTLTPLFTLGGMMAFWGIVMAVGILAGSYPAFHLARMESELIKKTNLSSTKKGGDFRKGLVVIQFATSIILLTGTLVGYQQMDFIRNKSLGFDKENVLYLPLSGPGSHVNADVLQAELSTLSKVKQVSKTSAVLGLNNMRHGVSLAGSEEEDFDMMNVIGTDPFLKKTMGFELVEGNWFREDNLADAGSGFVINEAAVRHFKLEAPLQSRLERNGQEAQVLGVVKDFHLASLHKEIGPLVIFIDTSVYKDFTYSNLVIRISEGNPKEALTQIESVWNKLYPDRLFEYYFQDEKLQGIYKEDQRFGRLITLFSILAIGIACLGLLGLVTFTASQRTKEIGIRKVLGATVKDIVHMLTRTYFALIMIAFLISIPVAWWLAELWLQDFAYRINVQPWVFGLAALVILFITAVTAGYQSFRAANANPVEALRDE